MGKRLTSNQKLWLAKQRVRSMIIQQEQRTIQELKQAEIALQHQRVSDLWSMSIYFFIVLLTLCVAGKKGIKKALKILVIIYPIAVVAAFVPMPFQLFPNPIIIFIMGIMPVFILFIGMFLGAIEAYKLAKQLAKQHKNRTLGEIQNHLADHVSTHTDSDQ